MFQHGGAVERTIDKLRFILFIEDSTSQPVQQLSAGQGKACCLADLEVYLKRKGDMGAKSFGVIVRTHP